MFWGIIFLTLGLLGLGQQFGYIATNLDLFWPVTFIAIGLSILFGKKGRKYHGIPWYRSK